MAREREIEEAIRLILATAPGNGRCGRSSAAASTSTSSRPSTAPPPGGMAFEVQESLIRWEPRIRMDVGPRLPGQRSLGVHASDRHQVHDPGSRRPTDAGLPLLHDPGGGQLVTLPAPNLDDRRFQELVDEAKRMVQRRCPEWTDHNVSDPGVTLIETFAYMVDQLIYRVNRVPDRMYIKFLDLLGVQMFPPTAANTDVTFWLSAPQAVEVTIPRGTSVATRQDRDRGGCQLLGDPGPGDPAGIGDQGSPPRLPARRSRTTPTGSRWGSVSTPSRRRRHRRCHVPGSFPPGPVVCRAHPVRLRGPGPGHRPHPAAHPLGGVVGHRVDPPARC